MDFAPSDVGFLPCDHRTDGRRFGDVARVSVQRHQLERLRPDGAADFPAYLPAAAKHQDLHATALWRGGVSEFPTMAEQLVEILDGAGEPLLEIGVRLPTEHSVGFGDVGTALDRVVDRQRPVGQVDASRSCRR